LSTSSAKTTSSREAIAIARCQTAEGSKLSTVRLTQRQKPRRSR
jgi:hypothetical protein